MPISTPIATHSHHNDRYEQHHYDNHRHHDYHDRDHHDRGDHYNWMRSAWVKRRRKLLFYGPIVHKEFDSTLGFPGEGPQRCKRQACKVEDFTRAQLLTEAAEARAKVDAGEMPVVVGSKSDAARRLFEDREAFRVVEFVRSDRGIWANKENAASLPIGCLSRVSWVKRLRSLTIVPPIEVGCPWSLRGRALPGNVLVMLEVGAIDEDMKFKVDVWDCARARCWMEMSEDDIEDLGDVTNLGGEFQREEIVLETTPEDARRIRQIPGAKHIAQRRACQGRVRVTVDVASGALDGVTLNTSLWAKASMRARQGIVLYQTEEQWSQLGHVLATQPWISGRLVCESPRWVIIAADSQGVSVDDILGRLTRLREDGAIQHDLPFRSWQLDAEDMVSIETGLVDGGTELIVENADPRFSVAACEAMLCALRINLQQCKIGINESRLGEGSEVQRQISVRVPCGDARRLAGIRRRMNWQGQPLIIALDRPEQVQSNHGSDRGTNTTQQGPTRGAATRRPAATPKKDKKRRKKGRDSQSSGEHSGGGSSSEVEIKDDGDEDRDDIDLRQPELGDSPQQMGSGDVVRAKRWLGTDQRGEEETLVLIESGNGGWLCERLGSPKAKVTFAPRKGVDGWLVEQKHRSPATKWFSVTSYGADAAAKAEECRHLWEREMARALLLPDDWEGDVQETLRYSLNETRKCEESEAIALQSECIELGEGKAEWMRRCAAARFKCQNDRDSATQVQTEAPHEEDAGGGVRPQP